MFKKDHSCSDTFIYFTEAVIPKKTKTKKVCTMPNEGHDECMYVSLLH